MPFLQDLVYICRGHLKHKDNNYKLFQVVSECNLALTGFARRKKWIVKR